MSLPPEITDCIIDHCHADRSSLSACGMVCKSWYAASRYHLFSTIEISNVKGQEFHRLLQSSSLSGITITPYLRELSFHLRAGDTETWLADLVSTLPDYVPLSTLRIFCHGAQLSEKIQQKLTTTFRSITSLALFEFTLHRRSLANDVAFICSFKNLETVLFYGHHRHEMDIPQDITLPSRVKTLKLDLTGTGTESFMRWLLSHDQRVPLVSGLHVFRITDDSNSALRAYLNACKNSLTDVMLFLYRCRIDPGDFDFTEHTALKNVYLNFNGTSTTRTAYDVLSTARSCNLENILLRISASEVAKIESWVPLDELFTSMPSFTKVTLAIDEHGVYKEDMRRRFPSCDAQGQLDIVHVGKPNIATEYVKEVYDRMKNI